MSNNYAIISDGIVTNIIVGDVVGGTPVPPDNPAFIGGDYVEGYFYAPQPFPSWTRDVGTWQPPVPKPETPSLWMWNEAAQEWEPESLT
jgi:hypothetical protein